MRYVQLERLRILEGWEDRSRQASKEIESLAPDQRKAAINARSEVWAGLKPALRKLSHNKCWYCETRQERSDNVVDHFRPKNRVAECPDHKGYWWLAFDWRNYRFSCTYCNSRRKDQNTGAIGGKQDYFPLLDEKARAYSPDDDINAEQPCLLDPTRATDPGLLWFQQDGQAVPRYGEAEKPLLHERAYKSIELYHLNYADTLECRKALFNEVNRLVMHGRRCFDRLENGHQMDHLADHSLEKVMRDMAEMLNERAEFSSAAKAYLHGFREDEWVEAILTSF